MNANFEYWLFDLDGTITDSSEGIINSYKRVERKMGLSESDNNLVRQFIGPSIHEFFTDVHKLKTEKLGKAITHYREYYSLKGIYENKIYDGVTEMLDALTANERKIYLVTGKPEIYAREVLRYFRLEKHFIDVFGSELGIANSSKEELLERFLSSSKAEPDKCIMVGDRKHDIVGAKYHGITSAAVSYGYGSLSELQAESPDYIVNNPLEILNIVK